MSELEKVIEQLTNEKVTAASDNAKIEELVTQVHRNFSFNTVNNDSILKGFRSFNRAEDADDKSCGGYYQMAGFTACILLYGPGSDRRTSEYNLQFPL